MPSNVYNTPLVYACQSFTPPYRHRHSHRFSAVTSSRWIYIHVICMVEVLYLLRSVALRNSSNVFWTCFTRGVGVFSWTGLVKEDGKWGDEILIKANTWYVSGPILGSTDLLRSGFFFPKSFLRGGNLNIPSISWSKIPSPAILLRWVIRIIRSSSAILLFLSNNSVSTYRRDIVPFADLWCLWESHVVCSSSLPQKTSVYFAACTISVYANKEFNQENRLNLYEMFVSDCPIVSALGPSFIWLLGVT